MIQRQSRTLEFAFDPDTLVGQVIQKQTGVSWKLDLAAAPGVAVGEPEPMFIERPWAQHCPALKRLVPLTAGCVKSVVQTDAGVRARFVVGHAHFAVELELSDSPEELVFRLRPLPFGQMEVVAAELPGPLLPADGRPIQVLTAYRHQGRLYTGRPGSLDKGTNASERAISDGQHRLRFFGVLAGETPIGGPAAGYIAIIEENADAILMLRQGEAGRLACSVSWLPSLGTLCYDRVIRYRFQADATTTTLAKAFRTYAMGAGLFKSLRDKIAERPALAGMVGATACFIGYEEGPHDYVGAFKRLRAMGHERFYIFPTFHINCGFDDGFGGMKNIDIRRLHAELRGLGGTVSSWTYLHGLGDRPEVLHLALRNADGTAPLNWRIGPELWRQFCQKKAADFLAASEAEVMEADAHHFDVTASAQLMECYERSHPHDRRGDREQRIRQFQMVTSAGRIVASEGVRDWAVPHHDMGSNKEVPVRDETPAYRAIPVQHLVYHDAIFSLWWEVHPYDCAWFGLGGDPLRQSLTDLLYGDMPLIFPVGRQYRWKGSGQSEGAVEFDQSLDSPLSIEAAQRAVGVARNFGRLATEEMTDFAWLSDDGKVQQTQFANGVSVIANFGGDAFTGPGGRVVAPMTVEIIG